MQCCFNLYFYLTCKELKCLLTFIMFSDSVCLACYVANGHIVTFSLPSLKPLMDNNYLPLADVRYVMSVRLYLCLSVDMELTVP